MPTVMSSVLRQRRLRFELTALFHHRRTDPGGDRFRRGTLNAKTPLMQKLIAVCLGLLFVLHNQSFGQPAPLPNAHAHNDYEHIRPLLDALSRGFVSVEADVHLIKGELYVAHNKPISLKNIKTLQQLYLQPLDSIVRLNGGRVYPGYAGPFYLMIDFKTDADETYVKLQDVIRDYKHLLKTPQQDGPVSIYISGNRPFRQIITDPANLFGLDGRPDDLEQDIAADKMPVVSFSFKSLGYWNGNGEIPMDIQLKIRQLASVAHKEGKKFRLWATPDDPTAWQVLLDNGVDFINTDDLEGLKVFLEAKK